MEPDNASKRIGLATRGSHSDGLGHLMRTRALAEALDSLGATFQIFILGDHHGSTLFKHSGFPHIACDSDDEFAELLIGYSPDIAVFDMLTLSERAFSQISEEEVLKVSISPVFNQLDYVDILFHRTIYGDPEWKNRTPFPEVMKGLEYAVVSERCKRVSKEQLKSNLEQSPFSIAISMGGSDAPNRTLQILQFLKSAQCPLLIWIALGEAYTHSFEALVEAVRGTKHEVILVKSNESMWRILQHCCLVICAGGMTTYEAAFVGIPTINIPLHDDRNYLIRELEENSACCVFPSSEEGFSAMLLKIEMWESNRNQILEIHETSAGLISDNGALKIATAIINHSSTTV